MHDDMWASLDAALDRDDALRSENARLNRENTQLRLRIRDLEYEVARVYDAFGPRPSERCGPQYRWGSR